MPAMFGMIQRREGLRFAGETCEPFGVVHEEIGQDFDRDVAIQLRVAGAIHLAHTAGAQGGEDLVRAEADAGGKGQTHFVSPAVQLTTSVRGGIPGARPTTVLIRKR